MQNTSRISETENANPRAYLPSEISKPINRRQFALVIVLALFVIFATNAIISFSGVVDRIDGGGRIIEKKWGILSSLDQPVDWLILGDSSADQGVVPTRIEESLGGRAVNLATVGNLLAVNDVWMLDEYIENHGAPNNVVIIHVYDMWRRDAETSAFAKVPLTPGYWRTGTPSLPFTISESAELMAFRYLPLFQSQNLIKKLMSDPGKIKIPPRTIQSNGFTPVADPQPTTVEFDYSVHKSFYSQEQFELSEINRQALERLVELADEYEFDVYIANSPIFDGLKVDAKFQTYFTNVQDLLINLDVRSPYIHFVLCETPSYPKELMTNVDHLILEGALSFTDTLAKSIAANQDCVASR